MTPQEELEYLRTKVVDLEAKLADDKADLTVLFSVPPMLEKTMRALMQQSRLTTETLTELLGEKTEPKTAIFRLRKVLQKYGVEIKSRRNAGYWIDPEDRQRLIEALKV